ncbi:MAG TPA: universal stress protein [Pseudonocardia sp.]|nr:universal stress protein [Pseudonocardia sp.]
MSSNTVQDRPLLVGYDGSDDARAALETLAGLAPGAEVVVVFAYQPLAGVLRDHWIPAAGDLAVPSAEREQVAAAERIARDGADRATVLGLHARAVVAAADRSAAETLVAVAEQLDAAAIVVGARGHGGRATSIAGSVAHHLAHQSPRPTLLLPSPALAAARTAATARAAGPVTVRDAEVARV